MQAACQECHAVSDTIALQGAYAGGFQMVSLLHLAEITEQGVTFKSPVDGSSMLLTPEHSMQIQNQLGADIMMALDDVVSSVAPSAQRFAEATDRTTRWIDRCVEAHSRPEAQSLFAIVQVICSQSVCLKLAHITIFRFTVWSLKCSYPWRCPSGQFMEH